MPLKVGDIVKIFPGQQLGRHLSKIILTGEVIKVYEWSWTGQSTAVVRCKPQSRSFWVNLKHSKVEVVTKS